MVTILFSLGEFKWSEAKWSVRKLDKETLKKAFEQIQDLFYGSMRELNLFVEKIESELDEVLLFSFITGQKKSEKTEKEVEHQTRELWGCSWQLLSCLLFVGAA